MNFVVIKDEKLDIYYEGIINNRPTFTERMKEAYIYEFFDNQIEIEEMDEHFPNNLLKINQKLFVEFSMVLSLGIKVKLEYLSDDIAELLLKEIQQ